MNSKVRAVITVMGLTLFFSACGPKPSSERLVPIRRPTWSNTKAQEAIEKLAELYRANPDQFRSSRTYIWTGTWIWPETIGIKTTHLKLLKRLFYEGDDATREIVLNVVLMNIPANKLDSKQKDFLKDLVLLDTELKERRANVPPPSDYEEEIEEYVP